MSLENIKKLREQTGAGMVDCKKALEEAGDDMAKAVELLRKKGIAKAAKREDREASEGIIKLAVSDDKKTGYILEINAETDFVARNDKFQEMADKIMELIKAQNPADLDALLALSLDESTVKDALDNLSGTIGEKIGVKQFAILKSEGTVAMYSHMGGRIGALVALDKADADDLAYDIAMQVAASSPKYLNPEEVPEEEINKEKDIYIEQLKKEGKPENIIEKILVGKVSKYCEGICLTKQEFIKDDKQKVEQVLGDAKIEQFIRYSLS